MKPRLLDLFCGAGGCTKGYQRAGFHVIGVDIEPQPNYCGDEFVQADALEFLREHVIWDALHRFVAIHASPPCQHYASVTLWQGDQGGHPALIAPTRELLEATGLPWVIENVPDAREVRADLFLCGSMFGLPVRRHRRFETNWLGLHLHQSCQHRASDLSFAHKQERAYADAMGCAWMTAREGREAVPPAYTEHVGRLLVQHLEAERQAA